MKRSIIFNSQCKMCTDELYDFMPEKYLVVILVGLWTPQNTVECCCTCFVVMTRKSPFFLRGELCDRCASRQLDSVAVEQTTSACAHRYARVCCLSARTQGGAASARSVQYVKRTTRACALRTHVRYAWVNKERQFEIGSRLAIAVSRRYMHVEFK